MSTVLTRVFRGAHLESLHRGSVAVVDSRGTLLAFTGDPSLRACLRSSAKPFQALPLLEYGGAAEYELTGEELALTCASHGGEPVHVATAAALLRKGDFDESDLLCGAHLPYDEKAVAELRASGEPPSPLHNNCSGKHAGMLLATQVMDVPSARYIDAEHPLQRLMHATLADFAGLTPDEIPTATDGCGVPAYFLSLYRTALAYARLMATAEASGTAGALERYEESAGQIVESMTAFPYYVAGSWSMTTPLLAAFGGELLAKEGAEGFYAMALAPSLRAELTARLRVADDVAIGIALKLDDGNMDRGRNPAILRTLELLGIDPDARPELLPYRQTALYNPAGTYVGDIRADFDLEVL
ncbi:MAG: asparaginase [Acidobacteria bacterium]|nr:asparaginase [Acidobacteriota bacterium]MBV9478649.1 asparaginase [Acidobacteriota bacterium]